MFQPKTHFKKEFQWNVLPWKSRNLISHYFSTFFEHHCVELATGNCFYSGLFHQQNRPSNQEFRKEKRKEKIVNGRLPVLIRSASYSQLSESIVSKRPLSERNEDRNTTNVYEKALTTSPLFIWRIVWADPQEIRSTCTFCMRTWGWGLLYMCLPTPSCL